MKTMRSFVIFLAMVAGVFVANGAYGDEAIILPGGNPFVPGSITLEIQPKATSATGTWQVVVGHCCGSVWSGPVVNANDLNTVTVTVTDNDQVRSGFYAIEIHNNLSSEIPGELLDFIDSIVVLRPNGASVVYRSLPPSSFGTVVQFPVFVSPCAD